MISSALLASVLLSSLALAEELNFQFDNGTKVYTEAGVPNRFIVETPSGLKSIYVGEIVDFPESAPEKSGKRVGDVYFRRPEHSRAVYLELKEAETDYSKPVKALALSDQGEIIELPFPFIEKGTMHNQSLINLLPDPQGEDAFGFKAKITWHMDNPPKVIDQYIRVSPSQELLVRCGQTLDTQPFAKHSFKEPIVQFLRAGIKGSVLGALKPARRTRGSRPEAEKTIPATNTLPETNDPYGEIDPPEMEDLVSALSGGGISQVRNAAILGESGSGKSTLVSRFVKRVRQGAYPAIDKNTGFVYLNAIDLIAGAENRGSLEQRLKEIMDSCPGGSCVLVIDEIQTFAGLGAHKGSDVDVFNQLKGRMTDGSLRVIGLTTQGEFDKAFGSDSTLLRRFLQIKRISPSGAELVKSLANWVASKEMAPLGEAMLLEANRLARFYDPIRAEPGKTVSLLERAFSVREVKHPERSPEPLTLADLLEGARAQYQIPRWMLDRDEIIRRAKGVRESMDLTVIGQDEVKQTLIDTSLRWITRSNNPDLPAGAVMVVGPPGQAKTSVVKALATAWDLPYERLGMEKYPLGDVDGFLDAFAQVVRSTKFGFIALEEIEKAHPMVQNALLEALDSGILTYAQSSGKTDAARVTVKLSLKNIVFIGVSNAGTDFLLKRYSKEPEKALGFGAGTGTGEKLLVTPTDAELRRELLTEGLITRPILRRFPELSFTRPPTDAQLRAILKLHLKRAQKSLEETHQLKIKLGGQKKFIDDVIQSGRLTSEDPSVAVGLSDHLRNLFAARYASTQFRAKNGSVSLQLRADKLRR